MGVPYSGNSEIVATNADVTQKAHGYATYKASGSLKTTTTGNKGKNALTYSTIHPVDSGQPASWATNRADTMYTSIHGLEATYNPVGVTFIPSTEPIITSVSTVGFLHNPSLLSTNLSPCRWKILKDGFYRVYGATRIFDNTPTYHSCLMLWRRTGGTVLTSGTNVEGIGLCEQRGTIGVNQYNQSQLACIQAIDGIYALNAYDEIYFSVNADSTNSGYGDTIVTHMSIQEM